MKIAILGARGIPAKYSGFDTLTEELSRGLVREFGHNVIVYCRSSYFQDKVRYFEGIKLHYLPAPKIKGIESLFHSLFSALHSLTTRADIILFLDPGNAPFIVLLKMLGKRVVVHTDGLGWKRRKWGFTARRYYKMVEWVCAKVATELVTDNPAMKEYYLKEYNSDSVYIAYGATNKYGVDESVYAKNGLCPQNYLLVVARIEPENNPDLIINEYLRAQLDMTLVVVGDSPYGPKYMEELMSNSLGRVRFLGRIHNQSHLNALYKGAYLYIHGHEVGGTNPSLLRAMDAGAGIAAIDVPFNRAVLQNSGFFFKKDEGDLSNLLKRLVANREEVSSTAEIAQSRAEMHFRWSNVVGDFERLFRKIMNT